MDDELKVRISTAVSLLDEAGQVQTFGPGDEVPGWAREELNDPVSHWGYSRGRSGRGRRAYLSDNIDRNRPIQGLDIVCCDGVVGRFERGHEDETGENLLVWLPIPLAMRVGDTFGIDAWRPDGGLTQRTRPARDRNPKRDAGRDRRTVVYTGSRWIVRLRCPRPLCGQDWQRDHGEAVAAFELLHSAGRPRVELRHLVGSV